MFIYRSEGKIISFGTLDKIENVLQLLKNKHINKIGIQDLRNLLARKVFKSNRWVTIDSYIDSMVEFGWIEYDKEEKNFLIKYSKNEGEIF